MPDHKKGVLHLMMSQRLTRWYAVIDWIHLKHTGRPAVITSARDGWHMAGSRHYSGEAVDLRSRDVKAPQALVRELKDTLGADFDVVLEADHIHLEFDPGALRLCLSRSQHTN